MAPATKKDTKQTPVDVDPHPALPPDSDDLTPGEIKLLVRSRQNGAFDGGEINVGENASLQIIAEVFEVFGGPDGDVTLDLTVEKRRDTTEDWTEIQSFSTSEKTRKTFSATVSGLVRVRGVVSGTVGGHAVEIGVGADRK